MTETRTRSKRALDQAFETLRVDTSGIGLWLLTDQVRGWLAEIAAIDGLLTIYIQHTSASLLIQAPDPEVRPISSPRSSAWRREALPTGTTSKDRTTCRRTSKRR
jgi:hypothetical protein